MTKSNGGSARRKGRTEEIENNMRIIDILRDSAENEAASDFNGERRDLWLCTSASTPKMTMPKWLFRSPKQSNGDENRGDRCGGSKLGHWFCRHLRKEKKYKEEDGEEEEEEVEGEKARSSTSSGVVGSEERTDEIVVVDSTEGLKHKELFFNIGMGIGMTFLFDKWASEMNKMTELRQEMESFLRQIKNEFQGEDDKPTFMKLNDNSTSSSELVQDIDKGKGHSFLNQFHMDGNRSSMESNDCSSCDTSTADKKGPMMDQLEAELQFELDQLQLTMDREYSSGLSVEDRAELDNDTANCSERFSMNLEHYVEPLVDDNTENFGVSPRELERRLYELLYTRQQEKIAELESKLKLANKRKHASEWNSFDEGTWQLASERGNTFDEVI